MVNWQCMDGVDSMVFNEGTALVVEDNPDSLIWLVDCVGAAFPSLQVVTAGDVAGALASVNATPCQLALIDLGLPDGSGMDIIHHLRQHHTACHVVVATIYDDDQNLLRALKAGARGYILKDQDKEQIVGYLQGIEHNRPAMSSASTRRLVEHFNRLGTNLDNARLTVREVDVVCLVAKGYNVEEAAELLGLSADTIKGYVKTIYSKLSVRNRAELTLEAVRLGLVEAES